MIVQYLSFCDCLVSLSLTSSRFIHVEASESIKSDNFASPGNYMEMDGWMDGGMEAWKEERKDRWKNRGMDGWMNGWTDASPSSRWTDGCMHDWINQRGKVTKETLNLVKI